MVSKTQTLSNTLTLLVSKICEILIISTQMVSKKDVTSPTLVNTIGHATIYLSSSLSCKLHFLSYVCPLHLLSLLSIDLIFILWSERFTVLKRSGIMECVCVYICFIFYFFIFFQCNLMLHHNFWPELSYIVIFIKMLCAGSTRIPFKTVQIFFWVCNIYVYIQKVLKWG